MAVDVAGKVIVVLGGTSGIGLALARGLHDSGAMVVPSSRQRKRVEAAVVAIGEDDVPIMTCDTTDEQQLEVLREAVLGHYGRVDAFIQAAGVHRREPTLTTASQAWRAVVDINLTGTFLAFRTFGEPMIRAKAGSLLAISSMGATVGLSEAAAYCASKAGVELLVKVLAIEWAPHGIRVNALAPGFFVTDLNADILAPGTDRRAAVDAGTPMGRTGAVEELVGAATYLCSDSASFTTGTVLHVDGGFLAKGF